MNGSRIGGSFLNGNIQGQVSSAPRVRKKSLGLGCESTDMDQKYLHMIDLSYIANILQISGRKNTMYDKLSFKLGFPTSHGTFKGAVNILKNLAIFSSLLSVLKKDSFLFCFSLSRVFSRH